MSLWWWFSWQFSHVITIIELRLNGLPTKYRSYLLKLISISGHFPTVNNRWPLLRKKNSKVSNALGVQTRLGAKQEAFLSTDRTLKTRQQAKQLNPRNKWTSSQKRWKTEPHFRGRYWFYLNWLLFITMPKVLQYVLLAHRSRASLGINAEK